MKISDSSEYYHYQGASYKVLLTIFRDVILETRDFHFVDIGCGKGRAVLVAEFCGYNKLSGIDLDAQLINDAIENLKTFKLKRPESQIDFICENALDFDYPDVPTVYFLFNPFSEAILSKVLKRICEMSKEEMVFVYMNPTFPGPFAFEGITRWKTYKSHRYVEAIVFKREKINS
ncbi:MAG: class I SAM-dependent methyltransferase [Bacteroidia bacterium]|nr:class I SAM-dependent methyltransferase [Bacteroidia bacterium]